MRIRLPFVVTPDARAHIDEAAAFLSEIKALGAPELPPDVVDDSVAARVLGDADAPGEIKAQTEGRR